MGLMDKMKSAASELAEEAKKATSQAQGRFEETKLRSEVDDAAKRLGYLIYRERTKGSPAGSDADALVAEIRALEEQASDAARSGRPPPAPEDPA